MATYCSLLLFFFFFFLNGCDDALAQPYRFESVFPSIDNISLSYPSIFLSEQNSFGTVWPIHNNPATKNLSTLWIETLAYAVLCYVNISEDAFFLSVLLADKANTGPGDSTPIEMVSQYGSIVWMANRNRPAIGKLPNLRIEETAASQINNKALVLRGGDGEEVWRVNAGSAPSVELQGDGNFVIIDNNTKSIVWQSFDEPTDTLVPGQILRKGQRLVSGSDAGFSEGSFFMIMMRDGFSLFYNSSSFLLPYFSIRGGDPECGETDSEISIATEGIIFTCDSGRMDYFIFGEPSLGLPKLHLRSSGELEIVAETTTLLTQKCDIPNTCGAYVTCSLTGTCPGSCETESKEDCHPPRNAPLLSDTCSNPALAVSKMGKLNSVAYFPNAFPEQLVVNVSSNTECEALCYRNCTCAASFYDPDYSYCTLVEHVLHFTAKENKSFVGFIKMLQPISPAPYMPPVFPSTLTPPPTTAAAAKPGLTQRQIIFLTVGALVALLLFCVAPLAFLVHRRCKSNVNSESESDVSDDGFLQALQASLFAKFSYKDIQSITNNFAKILGNGGFGSVFEGVLPDSNKVAVKRLDGISQQGTKQFRAEVAILANIHHFNLVKLLGFCAHGSQRMLVYEHMPNGSLDAWIFGDLSLAWATRHMIARGVASGLAYLHEECDSKVIHLDIKPQNILLDHNFVAKVGDFGMSRLMNRGESCAYTTMRGTPGYLAPEWLLQGVANEKMDIYSYGMVLLELISGRKNYDPKTTEEDKRYFPTWAFKKVMEGKELEILDHKLLSSLHNSGELRQIRTLIRVSFLCSQDDPHSRPNMSLVVKMLDGEASVPPLPLNQHVSSTHSRIAELGIASNSSTYTFSSALIGR